MKVLLTQDVFNLGHAGEVKTVADGYGRNFLLPRSMAVVATVATLKRADAVRGAAVKRRAQEQNDLEAVAQVINGQTLHFMVRTGEKGDLPDQFIYIVGSDISVNPRLSLVLDVVGQHVINSPRLSTFAFAATGPAGRAALQDLRFQNASYWGSSGALGTKLNVAPRLLINFNLRFALNNGGLTDRLSPLIGAEFAF